MRRILVSITFCVLGCSVGLAQPVETTIDLSPCGGINKPVCMAFNPQQNELWVSGEMIGPESGYVAVAVNCSTITPVGKAHVAADVVRTMCYCPVGNKLYAANEGWYGNGHTLSVIDCSTRSTPAHVAMAASPFKLCYNAVSNKVYCLLPIQPYVAVVDCGGDSLVAQLSLGRFVPSDIVWSAVRNEVYVASCGNTGNPDSIVSVIDGVTDSVVATIGVGQLPYALCYNSRDDKVYVATAGFRPANPLVKVIDCRTRQVTAEIPVANNPQSLCYNSRDNKVYCSSCYGTDTAVVIIDASADTVLHTLEFQYALNGLCYDPGSDKVYGRGGYAGLVAVIDGVTDSLLREVAVGPKVTALCLDTARGRLYCTHDTAAVSVIDCTADSVVGRTYVGMSNPRVLCYNDSLDRLYSADWPSDVAVIDGATNAVLAQVTVGPHPGSLCLNTARGKVYCGCQSSHNVYVLDGLTGAILTVVPAGNTPRALCYDPVRDKVYCANAGSGDITVIACDSDRVVATIPAGTGPRALVFNPNNDRVYCANEWSNNVTVVDCTADTVTSTFPVDQWPFVLSLNNNRNKLYCLCNGGYDVVSIDCSADTTLVSRPMGWVYDICYGPELLQDVLYCAGSNQTCYVKLIECANDSIAATANVPDKPRALLYDSIRDRVFVTWWGAWPSIGKAGVIDAAERRLVYSTPWLGVCPTALAWNPRWNRLYVANAASGSISVVTPYPLAVSDFGSATGSERTVPPSIVRGVLNLSPGDQTAELLDASGRRVASLRSGSNDVSRLAPGVYFVQQAQRVTKVVLAR